MYDITNINSFLNTPRFVVSLEDIILWTHFNYIYDSNENFLVGKQLSY